MPPLNPSTRPRRLRSPTCERRVAAIVVASASRSRSRADGPNAVIASTALTKGSPSGCRSAIRGVTPIQSGARRGRLRRERLEEPLPPCLQRHHPDQGHLLTFPRHASGCLPSACHEVTDRIFIQQADASDRLV